MSDPLCATRERPAHTGPCYPEITAPLHARIADLERQLAAAITHPLAVAYIKAERDYGHASSPIPYDVDLAVSEARSAWYGADCPLRIGDEVQDG